MHCSTVFVADSLNYSKAKPGYFSYIKMTIGSVTKNLDPSSCDIEKNCTGEIENISLHLAMRFFLFTLGLCPYCRRKTGKPAIFHSNHLFSIIETSSQGRRCEVVHGRDKIPQRREGGFSFQILLKRFLDQPLRRYNKVFVDLIQWRWVMSAKQICQLVTPAKRYSTYFFCHKNSSIHLFSNPIIQKKNESLGWQTAGLVSIQLKLARANRQFIGENKAIYCIQSFVKTFTEGISVETRLISNWQNMSNF